MSYATFDAHDGQPHHDWILPDGTKVHGGNETDQSVVGACRNFDDKKLIDYLTANRLTPVMIVRAFNACGVDGVATVRAAIEARPLLHDWYATQEPLLVQQWNIPRPADPTAPTTPEERELLDAVAKYVRHLMAR